MGCFSLEIVVDNIISRLDFKDKFLAQRVNRLWRQRSKVVLSKHKELIITRLKNLSQVEWSDQCYYHSIDLQCIIRRSYQSLDFWRMIMETMPSLEVIHLDPRIDEDDESDGSQVYLLSLVKLVMSSQAKTLKCLWMPDFSHWFQQDYVFPDVELLPMLQDISFYSLTESNTRSLLKKCPKLRFLKFSADWSDWSLLPVGFKRLESKLYSGSFKGLHSLLGSPAASTIEYINYIRVTPEIYTKPYCLSSLKDIRVSIKDGANDCLVHFGRMLRFSPIEKVDMFILTDERLTVDNWNTVFRECRSVTDFNLYCPPRIFHLDGFMSGIVSYMKNLQVLDLGFAVTSNGLSMLSSLDHLTVFKELIFDPDEMFTEESLGDFLETCFHKRLTQYELTIRHTTFGMYWNVSNNFVDRLRILSDELSLHCQIEAFNPSNQRELHDFNTNSTDRTLIIELKLFKTRVE